MAGEFRTTQAAVQERGTRTESGITIYSDMPCDHLSGEPIKRIEPGAVFSMVAHFPAGHPLLTAKTLAEQEALLHGLITDYSSQKSRQILMGVTHVSDEVEVGKTDTGWDVIIGFQNTSPRRIKIPAGTDMFTVFERQGTEISGAALLQIAQVLSDNHEHMGIYKESGNILPFTDTVVDDGDEPVGIFLPYAEEIGLVKEGQTLHFGRLPARRGGLLETHTIWQERAAVALQSSQVLLYQTLASIRLPQGVVGLIDRTALAGEPPHSWSILLRDTNEHGFVYSWPIIGEHVINTQNENHPTGFVMQLYQKNT